MYEAGISTASLWNAKAKHWINGRKEIFERLKSAINSQQSAVIWFHCSSLGEFEQGRPVLEKLRSQNVNAKFVLTFFSPSGYEIRKDYKGADWVFYLPVDSRKNAKQFLDIINPSLVVFVKYDYWYYYLTECKKRNIPLLMISAIFRSGQPFFKWYGSLHRKMARCFTHFFVQDKESLHLLETIGINNVSIAGDTRFDRVFEIAANFKPIEEIEKYCGSSQVLVTGSTWPADEKIIKEATTIFPDLRLIIAPHEIHKEHLQELKSLFPNSIFFSELNTYHLEDKLSNCLIIDNIGMLSRLYHYATITYIGGGFNKGIHNTLEAAVFGKPVLFGPNYKKFREADELIKTGAAISIASSVELGAQLKNLLSDRNELGLKSNNAFDFVNVNRGATQKILGYIQEKRLLTN